MVSRTIKTTKRTAPAKPPVRPASQPTCEGFHVAADPSLGPHEAALSVKAAVAEVLGFPDEWRVTRISRERPEFALTRTRRKPPLVAGHAFDLARELARQPGIVAAEPALIVPGGTRTTPTPGVAFKGVAHVGPAAPARTRRFAEALGADDCEWSIVQVRAREAWSLSSPGRAQGNGILVGHPDTGYTHHPEIWSDDGAGNRVRYDLGYDFVGGDGDPIDELAGSPLTLEFPGHGTATASVLMSAEGAPDQTRFVTGVAPRATLVPYRVSTSVVHLSFKKLTSAIYAAVEAGCHVISMSLGGPIPSGALERALRYAVDQGVILVAAAGNYWPWVVWPAAYGEVIAVAACNASDTMWKFSATGPAVEITAPGEDVWNAQSVKAGPARYEVVQGSGTSFAVAHVAGAAALWLAHHGRDELIEHFGRANLASAFRTTLRQTVRTPTGWNDMRWGAGILNAEALLAVNVLGVAPAFALEATVRREVEPAPGEIEAFLEKLRNYYPDASDASLRKLASRFFGSTDLDTAIQTFGHEILVHLGTDVAFRNKVGKALASPTASPIAVTRTERAMARTSKAIVPDGASSGLMRRLHGAG